MPKRSTVRPLEAAFARQKSTQDVGSAISLSSDDSDESDTDEIDSGGISNKERTSGRSLPQNEEQSSEPVLKKRRVSPTKSVPLKAPPFDGLVRIQSTVSKQPDGIEREDLDVNEQRWKEQCDIAYERMGNVPPVHGQKQNRIHQLLRVFDMSYEYGPCAGVTRLERWQRARAMGLNPPDEIRMILETKQGTTEYSYKQSVLYGEV